ncbi:MAG: YqjF family protein, partial [Haloferacaceae archaeon]
SPSPTSRDRCRTTGRTAGCAGRSRTASRPSRSSTGTSPRPGTGRRRGPRGAKAGPPERRRMITVTVRDALFVHWPVDPDALAERVPDPLVPETFDGSAWVSALALENRVSPGSAALPAPLRRRFPQLNLRTYVALDGDPGVYFLSLDAGGRLPAAVGRRLFGLPFRHARVRLDRRDGALVFRSRRRGPPPARFAARYRPTGAAATADPGTLAAFCVERDRYYVPAGEDPRSDAARALSGDRPAAPGGADGHAVRVGSIERDPWPLRPVDATVRPDGLFAAADLPAPTGDPILGYSPGVEMAVGSLALGPDRAD